MLTPQEVASHAFSKATFNGYNMSQVDEFLDTLTEDYTALYKENAVLKSKMKVLVDKIEEYRATEDAMRSALLTAQKMANSMVAEAEEKKRQLLRDAEHSAASRASELRRQIADEENRLAEAKRSTVSFTTQMKELIAREIQFLSGLPQMESEGAPPQAEAPDPAPAPAEDVKQRAQEIEQSIQAALQEEEALDEVARADTKDIGDVLHKIQEAVEREDGEDARSDRVNLQFGKNYRME
ncbi:MAG: DivIVA domain-containing protein [Oscillospiraceae bacterium]|nr:DivIVA domain-containing protein [Oscillospiraceae bacterium]